MNITHIAKRNGRLSSFLKEELQLSTALMNKLKWQDKLFVNGIPRHADFQIQQGDVITVPLEEETPQYPAENAPFTLLYEDEHLLAVDKPAGMLIHPSRAQFTGTLANRVLGYYQKTGQNCAFHPMTRLDRDTFGIVLLAKNAHIHTLLQQTNVEKTYHAVVFGHFPEEAGTIDAPIARKPLPSLLREVRSDGKPSLTRYEVLETTDTCTRVALQPVTGRTHQLRVHCAYLGCPILGDPQYGTENSLAFSREKGINTQLLCAKKLELTHPVNKAPLVLESKLDAFISPL
jgi:23S rRNA pseudouridine1911/1915/1917 synthase